MGKHYRYAIVCGLLLTAIAVSTEANVIEKRGSTISYFQSDFDSTLGSATLVFSHEAILPVGIKMPEMKLRYREYIVIDNSVKSGRIALPDSRGPPKLR